MLGLLPAATPGAALHVVFSAECTPLFDWHSVGLFYSFYASGQHGNITRLLACSKEQLQSIHRNYQQQMSRRRPFPSALASSCTALR